METEFAVKNIDIKWEENLKFIMQYVNVKLIAVVMVGHSGRFPKKHLASVQEGVRLIDVTVENLRRIGFQVIVYSKYRFPISVPLLLDEEKWILPSIITLLRKMNQGIFIFGGDMPLIKREAVEKMMPYLSHAVVVPRWKNGYLEPLHAYYTPKIIPVFEKVLNEEKPSLHRAIEACRDVYYVPAEKMPEQTFFNVNTPEDLNSLRELIKS